MTQTCDWKVAVHYTDGTSREYHFPFEEKARAFANAILAAKQVSHIHNAVRMQEHG